MRQAPLVEFVSLNVEPLFFVFLRLAAKTEVIWKKRRNDYIGIKTTSLCRCGVEDFKLYLHYQNIDQGRGILALDQSESKAKRSVTSTKDDKMHTGS